MKRSALPAPALSGTPSVRFAVLSVAICSVLSVKLPAETAVIRINADKPGTRVNPAMYGIFLEEINHGVDGGLYAELIRNRGFEDSRPPEGYTFRNGRWRDERGFDSGFSRYGYTTNGVPFWTLVQSGDAKGTMRLETSGGVTKESACCLRLDIDHAGGGRVGVANEGFFGIGVRQGESYALSLYARGEAGFEGPLSVHLEDAAGTPCSSEAEFANIGRDWKQFKATLQGLKTDSKARLVMVAGGNGKVWLDFVSLFPAKTWKDRPNGLRPDIAQMIADLHPGFVRFPGGCVVEAGTVETAYNWKLTVGPLERRQERWGPWNYRRTQGMGLHEYLQFCEDLSAEPLYVGFAGQTCIFRQRENVPMEEMGWVRDNFLDVVEYANGSADSKWGALRAQAGHRAPFGLKLVEIGNENEGREFGERYRFVHDAMRSKHPDLTYFADLSWTSRASLGDAVFDVQDMHYYNPSRWFVSRFNEYDSRDRAQPPLYLGEVAVTSPDAGPQRGNLRAALAEGVFLMGCERNADTVRMVSYAPLLAHVEGRTELTGAPPPWHAMIYFDGTRVFGTASYYLWKLFGWNRPDQMVSTEVSFPDAKPAVVTGQIGVGTWNTSAEFKDIQVERDGQVLYRSDFAEGAEGWASNGGQWATADGVYRQSRRGQGFSYFGDETWTGYTLTLKARKLGGGEGFMIVFGCKGSDRYWWNLGGWGNQEHGIEFNQNPVGRRVRGQIETDRWYDIKVELNGRRIRCYLDGQLLHDANAPEPDRLFANAGRDAASGDLILKVINPTAESFNATMNLGGVSGIAPVARITTLTSANPADNNTLENPARIIPTTATLEVGGTGFAHQFGPCSLTVVRLQTR